MPSFFYTFLQHDAIDTPLKFNYTSGIALHEASWPCFWKPSVKQERHIYLGIETWEASSSLECGSR